MSERQSKSVAEVEKVWTFRTEHGLWSISRHEGKHILMFNGERLAQAVTASDLLLQVQRGGVVKPVCGLDPSAVGLPASLSGWQRDSPAVVANTRVVRDYPRLCAGSPEPQAPKRGSADIFPNNG